MRVVVIVLKIGPDLLMKPIQLGTRYKSSLVKPPRTGQKSEKTGN